MAETRIAVVIPCYKVKAKVSQVIAGIGPEVAWILCVDDACPEKSGDYIRDSVRDPRVSVIRLTENQGVGGATCAGYRAALEKHADVVVKLDGDGQMDPKLIPTLVKPIAAGAADYAKGNRFYNMEDVAAMPLLRLLGNAFLSFASKFSSGYWSVVDPTNGYTAVHGKVLSLLPLDKLSRRWFFESDMLFRLNTIGAVIADVPMRAVYADERSNFHALTVIPEFAWKHLRNYLKRIFYNYFLRGFSIASVELLAGIALLTFGIAYGAVEWEAAFSRQAYASAGTVMMAALPVILGFQLLLSFLNYDIQAAPTAPLQGRL
ncbi:MAG: glycosyltransferase family 2 protein [Bacillota bacterium]